MYSSLDTLTSSLGMLGSSKNFDVEDPKTAEEYSLLSCYSQFILHLKWTKEEFGGGEQAVEKIKRFSKPLIKDIFVLVDKNNDKRYEEETLHQLSEKSNVPLQFLNYLKIYKDRILKKPKYEEYFRYCFTQNTYKLVGNDYIKQ